MGVPAFYRWLSLKYPKIITDLLEKRNQVVGGEEIPLNLCEPNPNGIEYDNLYIDMNGLIHPCSHPEDREAPLTEADMYLNVTKYVDRLFAAIRPRRLLFLAIDGVAPRAKMNQQRARRFRAAQEATERAETMQEVLMEMEALGLQPPPSSGLSWDSNVITPGTEFMDKLSLYLRFYILDRMNRNPAWKTIKVIFSDASEPGEGEHKIMKFIRSQRCQEGYDPNQRHILHGLDADLIMLGLATHEAHFTILREEVTFGGNKRDSISEAKRYLNEESVGISSLRPEDEWIYTKPLQCLHIHILREYLEYEFKILKEFLPFPYDLERIIDDFVFICFFVGNDFLPHLPSLDIRDGAIDFLIEVYKEMLPAMGNYVTSPGGNVNLRQVDILLSRVGEVEDEVFQRRKAAEDREAARMKRSNESRSFGRSNPTVNPQIPFKTSLREPTFQQHSEIFHETMSNVPPNDIRNASAASILREKLGKSPSSDHAFTGSKRGISDIECQSTCEHSSKLVRKDSVEDGDRGDDMPTTMPRHLTNFVQADDHSKQASLGDFLKKKLDSKQKTLIEKNKLVIEDVVKFHEKGWKDRYYGDKYKKEDIEKNGGLSTMCEEYIKGLCWVLKYYYQGCPSWNWYYPFHYAPFASDLVNVDSYQITFELSQPFRPIEQLLAVLPADSVKALPESCQQLMLNPDSPIIDIYSRDIPIDPNGKILPWLWVVLLPFIDESRIVSAMQLCESGLTDEERRRNTFGTSLMFLHNGHALGISSLSHIDYSVQCDSEKSSYKFPPSIGEGITGFLSVRSDLVREFGLQDIVRAPNRPLGAFQDIAANRVLCFVYNFPPESNHQSILLTGVDQGTKVLSDFDGIVSRPKLNKGRFNIADIAERMREERATGAPQPYQRMIHSGLGKYPSYPPEPSREDNHLYHKSTKDYSHDYSDRQFNNQGYRSNREYQSGQSYGGTSRLSARGGYDGHTRDRDREYSSHDFRYSHQQFNYPDNRAHNDRYPFHPPPLYSQPQYSPPSYSSHPDNRQYGFYHSATQSFPPRSRAPPIPQFSGHTHVEQTSGAPQSLANIRHQISHPASQENRYNPQPSNHRDPRMRR